MATKDTTINIIDRKGIFGFGLSNNNNLDLLNIIVLACAGIIIKIFFQENYSKLGNIGPASTTIWGYGLTALALIIMTFMSLYLISKTDSNILENKNDIFSYMKLLLTDTLPIFLTFSVIMYIIILNFIYFNRINTNKVSDSYHTYSLMSSILIIIQLGLLFKYLYSHLKPGKSDYQNILAKKATYILGTVNIIFVLIIHILLAFYSTDG